MSKDRMSFNFWSSNYFVTIANCKIGSYSIELQRPEDETALEAALPVNNIIVK